MSSSLNESVINSIKLLITHLYDYKENSELFMRTEKSIHTQLQNSDSLHFIDQKELDVAISGLCDKFSFHGLLGESRELKHLYEKLIPPEGLSKQDRLNRLNVIKFLFSISHNPTNNLDQHPQSLQRNEEEDVIDWPTYLTEGIPRWSPPIDKEDSESWSDNLSDITSSLIEEDVIDHGTTQPVINPEQNDDKLDPLVIYHNSRADLLNNVQSGWFNRDYVCFKPASKDKEANIALLWDDYLYRTTGGLLPSEPTNIISEYKVMREIIWQFYASHVSFCFRFMGNKLVLKPNLTISSLRQKAFQSILYQFIPYIEWLQVQSEFHQSLYAEFNAVAKAPPHTYRSYDYGLQTIIQPMFDTLTTLENKIREQETITTLIWLTGELRPIFKTIDILKRIHEKVVLDFNQHNPLKCATTLLYRLHDGLLYTSSKLEEDLYLTLYLHSLYKYFTIIHSWLVHGVFKDYKDEFIIAEIIQGDQDWQMEFRIKNLQDDSIQNNDLITIICTQVLQIGKNIHLLRLLNKLHLVSEFTEDHTESLYESYVNKILHQISLYSGSEKVADESKQTEAAALSSPTFICPVICPDECKYLTEMDRLENLVDTSNVFLMKAFESYFTKKPTPVHEDVKQKQSLFEKIRNRSEKTVPIQRILKNALLELLEEQFGISGLMVKNVLINEYHLRTQFSFLKHIYLFKDDLIFPLYRRIFHQIDTNGLWGNHLRLTSQLQDIIIDLYPNFYDKCNIEVKDSWRICFDPLKACKLININYNIPWPVSIIIKSEQIEMYKELFQFILMIKWAMYTLNHLYFRELEPKGKPLKNQNKAKRGIILKLEMLRFGLVNSFSSIQHFILGYIFMKHAEEFDKNVEEAYDLGTLVNSHGNFIESLYKDCTGFRDYNKTTHGFFLLLYLVQKLGRMWHNLADVDDEELEKCEKFYFLCDKELSFILNPTYI